MQRTLLLGMSAGLLLSAVPALADGMETRRDRYVYNSELPTAQYNWSGIYFGGHAGGAYTQWDWTFTSPNEALEQSRTGFAGGAQIGVQQQWHRVVLGAEVSYTWADMDETSGSAVTLGTARSAEVSNLLLASGRLGFTHDNMLAYAKAGYATADVDFRSANTSGVVTTSSSGREHGWVAGVGADYGLTPNISIGIEYNYIHLEVEGRDQVATSAGVAGSRVVDAGVDIQTVMARLNFKFGPRTEAPPFK